MTVPKKLELSAKLPGVEFSKWERDAYSVMQTLVAVADRNH